MYYGWLMQLEESASFVHTCMESSYIVYSEHLNHTHIHCVCVYVCMTELEDSRWWMWSLCFAKLYLWGLKMGGSMASAFSMSWN